MQRSTSNETAAAGMINLLFKNAPVVFDRDCTADVMYFLNSNAVELVIESSMNFVMGSPIEPENQAALVSKMLAMLQVVVTDRRRLGKLTGLAA